MTTAAITGHRPNKLNNWQYVEAQLALAYLDLKVDKVIQGCAPGADLLSAQVAWAMHIPYVCARPWAGHLPSVDDKVLYDKAISHAESVHVVVDQMAFPGNWAYQKRNEWMVDRGDVVIAVWDGSKSGTGNTVTYAMSKNKMIWRINPTNYKVGWFHG